jgi:hypothetical protein
MRWLVESAERYIVGFRYLFVSIFGRDADPVEPFKLLARRNLSFPPPDARWPPRSQLPVEREFE